MSVSKLRNVSDLRYKPGAFLPQSDSDLFDWTFQSADELARRLDVWLSNLVRNDTLRDVPEKVNNFRDTECAEEISEYTYLLMRFGQNYITAKVDSGCKFNLASEKLWQQLKKEGLCSDLQLVDHVSLEGPDQRDIALLGQVCIMCDLVCSYDQRRSIKMELVFLVVRNLGHDVLYGSQEICRRKTDVRLYDGVLIFENVSPFIPIGLIGVKQDPREILRSVARKYRNNERCDTYCCNVIETKRVTFRGSVLTVQNTHTYPNSVAHTYRDVLQSNKVNNVIIKDYGKDGGHDLKSARFGEINAHFREKIEAVLNVN